MARIVLAGYLVRFPLGGYAWQTAHYLLGFRALGHDTWFYEDTGTTSLRTTRSRTNTGRTTSTGSRQ